MLNEIEKMYKLANVAKPVIKKWYYDGYYEDFSWQTSEEDCTELLKYFDNSVDKLNDRIQQMKKEENTKYDRYTDSVDTEFGRVEKAYIDYPPFTAEKQLELIKWLASYGKYEPTRKLFLQCLDGEWYIAVYEGMDVVSNGSKVDFKECLARVINKIWQSLTEEEKQQVKGILE